MSVAVPRSGKGVRFFAVSSELNVFCAVQYGFGS
jgi:hypothetical protein